MAKYNVGDEINFLEFEYELVELSKSQFWWSVRCGEENEYIFKVLFLNKEKFTKNILGYCHSGDFPVINNLEDVEKLTDALLLNNLEAIDP